MPDTQGILPDMLCPACVEVMEHHKAGYEAEAAMSDESSSLSSMATATNRTTRLSSLHRRTAMDISSSEEEEEGEASSSSDLECGGHNTER
jgi:hypothetical protein